MELRFLLNNICNAWLYFAECNAQVVARIEAIAPRPMFGSRLATYT